MQTVSKSRLKAEMLGIFRELERSGGELIVTDRGRPTLKISSLVPPRVSVDRIFSDVANKVIYHEDIMKPTDEAWSEV